MLGRRLAARPVVARMRELLQTHNRLDKRGA
jgi:hypothetical protein